MRWIAASLLLLNVIVLVWQLAFRPESGAAQPTQPVPDISADVPQLQLLGELDEAARQPRPQNRPRVKLGADAADIEGPLCTLVGPFPELLRAEYFVERLAALDLRASVRELEIPGEPGYWVYLPPLESRREAFNRLRELQNKGIDSYVIPKGELENGISFGMFSQPELADQRLQAMQEAGYSAELTEITRSYEETWVVLPPGQAGLLDSATWQELLATEEALERRQNYCPPVASE